MKMNQLEITRKRSMEAGGFGPRAMMKVKICPQCGNISSVTDTFCKECGYLLPKKSLYQKYKETHLCCPVCDTVVSKNTSYCPQCGQKIEDSSIE